MEHRRKQLTRAQRKIIYNKYKGHCAYCGCKISESSFVIDHVIPVRESGSTNMENLLPACRSCNNYKSAYSIGDINDTETWGTFRNMLTNIVIQLNRISIFKLAVRYGIITINKWDRIFYYEKADADVTINQTIEKD
jgi:hypothetical protein